MFKPDIKTKSECVFEIGDKVVCILEPNDTEHLTYGKIFTIKKLGIGLYEAFPVLNLNEIPLYYFPSYRFKRLIDFRKEKIFKLKERINVRLQ